MVKLKFISNYLSHLKKPDNEETIWFFKQKEFKMAKNCNQTFGFIKRFQILVAYNFFGNMKEIFDFLSQHLFSCHKLYKQMLMRLNQFKFLNKIIFKSTQIVYEDYFTWFVLYFVTLYCSGLSEKVLKNQFSIHVIIFFQKNHVKFDLASNTRWTKNQQTETIYCKHFFCPNESCFPFAN